MRVNLPVYVLPLLALLGLVPGLSSCERLRPEAQKGGSVEFPSAKVAGSGPISLRIELPSDYKLNPAAPSELRLAKADAGGADGQVYKTWDSASIAGISLGQMDLGAIPEAAIRSARGQLLLEGALYVCQKSDSRICARIKVRQVLEPATDAASLLIWRLAPPI